MKLLLVPLLLLVMAQFPSCGQVQTGDLVGFVDDKYVMGNEFGNPTPVIMIGATEYQVPWEFYREVRIGDLVKFSNGRWTIVKRAGS